MNSIRIVKRKEIDDSKWNELVDSSTHSLPYAFSWYLDAVAEHWDALVVGDYEVVMPLVWLRRFGVKYLYQPYYCQQLGYFCRKPVESSLAKQLLATVRKKFLFADINLNPSVAAIAGEWKLGPKKNLLLNLESEYILLKGGYTENHRRNMAKAEKTGLTFKKDLELQQFQSFYLQHVNRDKERFKEKHTIIFKSFTDQLISRNKAKIFAVINKEERVVAEVMAITHHNRIITVINSSSEEGKKTGASQFLFDKIIQTYAATGQVLDFEGSSVPSIARFYEGFGAREEVFYNYKRSIFKV